MKRSCLFQQLVFICLSLDDVVNLRVEGVGEVLLAGVLTLQAQCTSSDKDSEKVFYIHISLIRRKKFSLFLYLLFLRYQNDF